MIISPEFKDDFLKKCKLALDNLQKSRVEDARKAILKYIPDRKAKQAKRNSSLFRKLGIFRKDTFPNDVENSFFVNLYMGIYKNRSIDNEYYIPRFEEIGDAPDWWTVDDFLLTDTVHHCMITGLAWDRKIRDLLVAVKYGNLDVSAELISYIEKWSKE